MKIVPADCDEVLYFNDVVFIPEAEKVVVTAGLLTVLLQLKIISYQDVIPLLDLANN